MKKIIAILLCLSMLVTVLAACKSKEDPTDDPAVTGQNPIPATPLEIPGEHESCAYFCFVDAFNAFPPDEVMFTVDGIDASWEQLFYCVYASIDSMIGSYGEITDWSIADSGGLSYEETVKEYSVANLLMYKGIEANAALKGIAIGPEDEEEFNQQFQGLADDIEVVDEDSDRVDELMKSLWNTEGIHSKDMFIYLLRVSRLMHKLFVEMYGQNAELVTDQMASELAAERGYLMAKQILFEVTDGDTAAANARAEEILRELEGYDGDDFEGLFDELMNEHSDDPGKEMFPYGYLFRYNDVEEGFSTATSALEVGELSGIVETDSGLHIIYRLPINYDEIPMAFVYEGQLVTLRYAVANEMFEREVSKWSEALEPVYTDAYTSINFNSMFKPCEYESE